jgi:predicted neuraminidase
MKRRVLLLPLIFLPRLATAQEGTNTATTPAQPGLVAQEFVYGTAPFLSCHAATIEATKGGLVAAWFGGTREGHRDVAIWTARYDGTKWLAVMEVANGEQSDGTRHPCWNPVLFQPSKPESPLLLFYKVGPSPSKWWGMRTASTDGGKTWSKPERLPDGILGPVKNKPIELPDGTLLCGSSTEHDGWRVHMERTSDGTTWTKTEPLNDGKTFGAIQPTILKHADGLQILCRSQQKAIVESWSTDGGKTWSELARTTLPNNNSGLDAVTLKDGRSLLVYNHTTSGRSPLNLSSTRDGKTWERVLVFENQPGEYSYPAIIQAADGKVHAAYTYQRKRIKHVVIDPGKLASQEKP